MGLSADGKAEGPSAEPMVPCGWKRQHRRLATPVEDWLRTAAVKDRIAGFLRPPGRSACG